MLQAIQPADSYHEIAFHLQMQSFVGSDRAIPKMMIMSPQPKVEAAARLLYDAAISSDIFLQDSRCALNDFTFPSLIHQRVSR